MTPSCTFNATVNGINNNTIIPSTIGLWPNKLNITEPKNNAKKRDTNLEIIACGRYALYVYYILRLIWRLHKRHNYLNLTAY